MAVPFSLLTAPHKYPDAALRGILRHCGVRQVRLIPQDLRALPADFFAKPSILANYKILCGFVIKNGRKEKRQ
jgi:hypothetical protein